VLNRIGAVPVGVYRERSYEERSRPDCIRCGRERYIHPDRKDTGMCKDCYAVEPQFGQVPFENLPVSDSNEDSFDTTSDSRRAAKNARRRAQRKSRSK
jgi:hypothetical protein